MEASTSSASGTQARQKRVLPSRARRGGPGVGNCDADVMILETQRRKPENEPLIPADTPFLLTTNSALASTSSSGYQVNVYANERYFERPEVLNAYREQLIIETPEFKSLGDTPVGRLRARSSAGMTEDGPIETSDAVYEKRHRKYETFEKRFRLREKEKLKHEQYKLKERIEQLRAMDASAFLALPDDLFPPPLHPAQEESHVETDNILGAPLASNHIEGERRRREMLKIASTIEDRFRVLLPPDKKYKTTTNQTVVEFSVGPELPSQVGKETSIISDVAPLIEMVPTEADRLKLKIKLKENTKSVSSKKRQRSVPPPEKQPIPETLATGASPTPAVPLAQASHSSPQASSLPQPYSFTPPAQDRSISLPPTSLSTPGIVFLQPNSPETQVVGEDKWRISSSPGLPGSTSNMSRPPTLPQSYKRAKLSPAPSLPLQHLPREYSLPPIASISAPRHRSPSHASTIQSSRRHGSYGGPPGNERHGLLVTHAIRSSSSKASKGQRNTYAFGGKVQSELFTEEKDFRLPDWFWDQPPEVSSTRSRGRKPPDAEPWKVAHEWHMWETEIRH